MKKYLGVKLINAVKHDKYEGSQKIEGETVQTFSHGYKVIYEDGYESWSPKDVFEKAYRKIDNLTFGLAIEALKQGYKVARSGWNGKGMFIFLTEGVSDVPYKDLYKDNWKEIFKGSDSVTIGSHIDMKAADNTIVIGWLASQTDMLAEDWIIVE